MGAHGGHASGVWGTCQWVYMVRENRLAKSPVVDGIGVSSQSCSTLAANHCRIGRQEKGKSITSQASAEGQGLGSYYLRQDFDNDNSFHEVEVNTHYSLVHLCVGITSSCFLLPTASASPVLFCMCVVWFLENRQTLGHRHSTDRRGACILGVYPLLGDVRCNAWQKNLHGLHKGLSIFRFLNPCTWSICAVRH